MPDKTIPELTDAAALSGAERLVLVQGGNSRDISLDELAAYIKTAETIVPVNLPYRGCRVRRTTDLTGLSFPVIVAWQAEDFDTDGFWSVGDPTKLVIPAGITKVRLKGMISFEHLAADGMLFASPRKNSTGTGSSVENIAFQTVITTRGTSGFSNNSCGFTSGVIDVVEGDYFDVRAQVNMTGQDQILAESLGSFTHFELEVVEVG